MDKEYLNNEAESLADIVIKKSRAETQLRISESEGVRLFHAIFDGPAAGVLITEGGVPCSRIEYDRAVSIGESYENYYHAHDCFFLVYVLNGTNLEIIEGEPLYVTENDLLLLTPYTRHHNYHTADSKVLFIHIEPDRLLQALMPAIRENALFSDFFSGFLTDRYVRKSLLFRDCMKEAAPILLEILREYTVSDRLGHSCIQYLLCLLIVRLARIDTQHARNFTSSSADRMEDVIRYITEHYQDVTLENAASQFGYNPAYLSRKIHQYSGKTYKQLLSDYRLNLAVIMIREGRLPVDDIAYECGYHDLSTFYKAFRNRFHCSPRNLLEPSERQ